MVNVTRLNILTLLKGNHSAVTGDALGTATGISKVAVWKHIQALRSSGYSIETSHSGYKFINEPDIPDEYQVFHTDTAVFHYDNVDSTMDLAAELHGEKPYTLVTTNIQNKGRARNGASWISPEGGLYATLALSPPVHAKHCTAYGFLSAVAIMHAVYFLYNLHLSYTWPCDLKYKGKKIGGILTEIRGELEYPSVCLIGLGMYIHETNESHIALEKDFPGSLSRSNIINAYLSEFIRMANSEPILEISQFIDDNEEALSQGEIFLPSGGGQPDAVTKLGDLTFQMLFKDITI